MVTLSYGGKSVQAQITDKVRLTTTLFFFLSFYSPVWKLCFWQFGLELWPLQLLDW